MNEEAVAILGRLNLRIDPTITLNRLPISKQQMVEIAKSLSFDSEVLIMDEPTSALTESEIDELFTVIHTLRDRGVAIIYISHRLEELKHIVDRISIFRDGRYVSTDEYSSITMEEIVNRMVDGSWRTSSPCGETSPRKRRSSRFATSSAGTFSTTFPSTCTAAKSSDLPGSWARAGRSWRVRSSARTPSTRGRWS